MGFRVTFYLDILTERVLGHFDIICDSRDICPQSCSHPLNPHQLFSLPPYGITWVIPEFFFYEFVWHPSMFPIHYLEWELCVCVSWVVCEKLGFGTVRKVFVLYGQKFCCWIYNLLFVCLCVCQRGKRVRKLLRVTHRCMTSTGDR